MTHIRTDIRLALLSILGSARPDGWEVEASRDRLPDLADFKVLFIGFEREDATRGGQCQPYQRDMIFSLTAHVAAAADIDGEMDAASTWIEQAIEADPTLGGVASDTIYRSCDEDIASGGEHLIGRLTLSYQIRARKKLADF